MRTCFKCSRPRTGDNACRCEPWEFTRTAASWPTPTPLQDLDEWDRIDRSMGETR